MGEQLVMPDARATSQTRFWKQTRREVKEEVVRQQQANEAKSKGVTALRPTLAETAELEGPWAGLIRIRESEREQPSSVNHRTDGLKSKEMKKSMMPGSTAQKVGAYQELEGRQVRLKALNLSLGLQDGPLQPILQPIL